MLPDIPSDVLSIVLRMAELGIDTKRALRMRPRRLDEARGLFLRDLFARRACCWNRHVECRSQNDGFSTALAHAKGPIWATGRPRSTMAIYIDVLEYEGRVHIKVEKRETIQPSPRQLARWPLLWAEHVVRRFTYSDVQTGETVEGWDEDEETLSDPPCNVM